jgi:hypothetical protein
LKKQLRRQHGTGNMSKVKRAWKEYLPFYKRTHEEYLHSRGLTTDDAIKRDLQDELLKIIGKLTTEDLEQTLSVSDIRESKLYKNISKLLAVPGADEEEIRAREKFIQAFIERVKPALRKKFVVLSKVVKKDEGPKWEHKEISSEDITREDVLEERKMYERKVLQD